MRKPRARYMAFSDASFAGWSWTWACFVEDGTFPAAWASRFGRLTAAKKRQLKLADPADPDTALLQDRIWITFCEALAALFCLRRVLPYVRHQRLTFNKDNQSVCGMLAKLQTSSVACRPVVTEIAWLLAAFDVELDVRYIRSEDNCLSDAANRLPNGDITTADYVAAYKAHLERYRIPTTTEAAGVHRGPPPRPELIEVMDAWPPEHAGGATGWHPRPF